MEGGDEIETLKRKYREFFEFQRFEGRYSNKLRDAVETGNFRVTVNMNDLRLLGHDADLMANPRIHMVAMQEAALEVLKGMSDPGLEKLLKERKIQIGFEGAFGSNSVSPRGLTSRLINKLVQVEGIVTKVSSVRAKLTKSVHLSADNKYTTREHRDASSADIGLLINGRLHLPQSALPTKDENGKDLDMEQGLCTYKDYQKVTLQEMPERARVGQLPRSVEILLEYDLVDRVKPGDRVQVVGLYRAEANELNGIVNTIFKTQLMGNNISVIGKEVGSIKLTAIDVSNIKDIASHENVLQMLSSSLCPSIFGHEFVKMALILQLLGGCERNLENGTHLRGDINVMFVGDPSTAKSQLLRSILDIAPLAISTTGKGSSGVGLTAAVSMDPETGEKRLEAGAMVLADRGIVCIDEFDKMGENDRTAIHEVMEQQTVTIAKAGIHASLNARCSVVAAANPIYGQYDKSRRPQENIGLPDSLLSRFDLLFIVLDQLDPTIDRRLSEHVVRNHQYRRPGTVMEPESLRAGSLISLEDHKESEDTPVWIRGGSNSSNSSSTCADGTQHSNDILSKEFLRKYIFYSKAQRPPTLTDEAMQIISASYAAMRSKSGMKNLPVTARTLETIIRLSTASAKTRLSRIVEAQDVECATELVNYVLFHEIGEQLQAVDSVMGNGQSQSNKRGVNQMEEEDERDGEGEENEAGGGQDGSPMRSPSARRRRRNNNNGTPSTLNSPPILNEKTQNSQNIAESEDYIFSSQYSQSLKSNSNSNSNSNSDRVKTVMDVVVKLTSEADTIYIDDIMLSLGEIRGIIFVFEEEEVLDVLSIMENNNKIMLDRADRSVMRI